MSNITRFNLAFAAAFAFSIIFLGWIFFIPSIKTHNFIRFLDRVQNDERYRNATLVVAAKYEGARKNFLSYNGYKRIHPGSNFKLFTAAASLAMLSADFRFKTQLLIEKKSRTGLTNVILVGGGDPSLTKKDISEFADALKKYKPITGNILYDDRIFLGERFGPGWAMDWIHQYFAVPVTGLQINDNLLEIRGRKNEKNGVFETTTEPLEAYQPLMDARKQYADPQKLKKPTTAVMDEKGGLSLEGDTLSELPFHTSATVKDPSRFTAAVLKQELLKAGLIRRDAELLPLAELPEKLRTQPVYEHQSANLQELIMRMLKFSKNNYAETLVRMLGKHNKQPGSQQKGVEVLQEFFDEIGIHQNDMSAFDGSGLSPQTRITGQAVLQLFDYVNAQPWKDIFWQSLPESRVDGTLKHRFENVHLTSPILAKTGTHEFSSSLSGKILREGGKNILFSIHIYNHPFTSEESIQHVIPTIDQITALLDKQF